MGIKELYYEWMCSMVFSNVREKIKYETLLRALNESIFHFSIPMDENRMRDGIDLRYRFAYETGHHMDDVGRALNNHKSCSMLEMMVALSIKGDERILYDYESGGKAYYIFDTMLESMQLKRMTNSNFNPMYVDDRINKLLTHDYNYDGGNGGLFEVPNPRKDMRRVDIWLQMNWYLQQLYNK